MPLQRCVVHEYSNFSNISTGFTSKCRRLTRVFARYGKHISNKMVTLVFVPTVCSPDSFKWSVHVDGAVRRLNKDLDKTWKTSERGTLFVARSSHGE